MKTRKGLLLQEREVCLLQLYLSEGEMNIVVDPQGSAAAIYLANDHTVAHLVGLVWSCKTVHLCFWRHAAGVQWFPHLITSCWMSLTFSFKALDVLL